MTDKPLVSVIINCYNSEKYLNETIESLIAQTYENWEAIFWDNCSNDSTSDIIANYNEPRFRYVLAEQHTTLGQARNLAMTLIKGELFCFLDSDDIWDNCFLKYGIEAIYNHPEIVAFYSNYNEWCGESRSPRNIHRKSGVHNFKYILHNYGIGISAVIMKTQIVQENGVQFDANYQLIEDMDFFYSVSALGDFYYDERPLYDYRIYPTSNSSQLKKDWIPEYINLYNKLSSKYININNSLLKERDLKYVRDRIVGKKIANYLEENDRLSMLKILICNRDLPISYWQYLLFVALGRDIFNRLKHFIRKRANVKD